MSVMLNYLYTHNVKLLVKLVAILTHPFAFLVYQKNTLRNSYWKMTIALMNAPFPKVTTYSHLLLLQHASLAILYALLAREALLTAPHAIKIVLKDIYAMEEYVVLDVQTANMG